MSAAHPAIARYAGFGFALALVSSIGQTFFIGLFGGEIQSALGIDAGRWGLLYGIATLASGGLMFWAGAQADHQPLRRVTLLALAILVSGALLMATATTLWVLVVAVFLLRFGGQGLSGHLAMVVAARPAQRRGRSLAVAAFGFIAGEALLPVSVVVLLGLVGWRELWALAGAGVVVLALPVLWWLGGRVGGVPAPPRTQEVVATLDRRQLLRAPAFRAALAVLLVSPFVVTALFLQQATLVTLKDWSLGLFASGFLVFALAQAGSNWISGALVDRFGARSVLRVYLLPLAIACLALGFVSGPAALWLMFAGLGVTAGAQGVVGGALWVELFGLRQLGLVRGVYFGFMVLTTAVSPFLLGAALSAGVDLGLLTVGLAVYACIIPWWVSRSLRHVQADPVLHADSG
ncbi:MFS transporter [Alkalisalibacterium limincola]|uniref:MFS transporter n=1 Tax=Alkalisalibacterium limincola TaxID=2699169 RepID=A0A5C8KRZ2_9GAMM|nr:MFS transporter [Alkalisalibacterium limincola]TXK62139.1 MFS transporter [Alkalisalibacterium limincola]